jgi:hypothetical protein
MLTLRHAIVGFALLTVVVGNSSARSKHPSPSEGKSGQPEQSQAEQTQQGAPADQRGTEQSPVIVKVLPTENSTQNSSQVPEQRNDKSTTDWWLVVFTGLLVVVGVGQGIVFAIQAYRLKQTVEEMKSATIATTVAAKAAQDSADALPAIERAYIFIVPKIIITFGRRETYYHCVNHGKTPAIINGIERHFDPSIDPPDNTNFRANFLDANEVVIAAGERYPREQDAVIPLPIQTGNMDDALGTPEPDFLWFYGTIVYGDVFGEQRFTRFRWRYNRMTKKFSPCGGPPYNERT